MHADEVLRRGANAGLFPQFTFGGLQQRHGVSSDMHLLLSLHLGQALHRRLGG